MLITVWGLIIWKTGLLSYLNLEIIKTNQIWLREQLNNNFYLALLTTCIVYFVWVSVSLPGIFVLAVLCGYLFGAAIGSTILVLIGGLGTCVPYFLSRFLMSDWISKKFSTWIPKIRSELSKNPALYMLAMRLNPAIPFIVQNTVPGVLGISPKVYIPTTFIGITPPSIAVAMFGSGLNGILAEQSELTLRAVMSTEIVVSLFMISFLICGPLIFRSVKSKSNEKNN